MGMVHLLTTSHGEPRGARSVPDCAAARPAPRGWVAVRRDAPVSDVLADDLPPPVPGYRASWGSPVRGLDAAGAEVIGYAHWRPAGEGHGFRGTADRWTAAWIDGFGRPLSFEVTHWWAT